MKEAFALLIGSPKGSRTPVSAVRGRHPWPLDDGALLAADQGFEPWRTDPESVVLPLHQSALPILFVRDNNYNTGKYSCQRLKS
jgi:hypothetical protein